MTWQSGHPGSIRSRFAMTEDAFTYYAEFFATLDRLGQINYLTFLVHELERATPRGVEELTLMLELRTRIRDIGGADAGHIQAIENLERAISKMLKRDRNILIQAANHSRPSTSAGGALSSAGGNDTASEAVNKASTGLKAAAVCGVVIAGLDTVVRAKDAYDNPNVTTVSRLGVSSARGAAAIRNANKVFTKGVVSGTAKKICAVAGVAGVVIDVYGNIVDPELTTGGKTLASTVDIIAGGLCFLGPVGIGVGICVGIASTVWLKPALRTTPTTT